MATPAQIAANQANARKSTGPRTDAGKQVTRQNAITHGLCTFITCLDSEDPDESDRLLADLMDEHQSQGATEQILVNKMAEQFWLQKRAAYYLAQHTDYNEGNADEDEEAVSMKQMALYLRYYSTAERAFNRNLHDLRKIQKDRIQHAPPVAETSEIGSVPQNAKTSLPPTPIVTPPISKPAPVEPIFSASSPSAAVSHPASPHEKAA